MAKTIYEAVLDEYTCEGCLERHGREVKANDKPFSVCKNIDTDIGCRCVLKESKKKVDGGYCGPGLADFKDELTKKLKQKEIENET